MARAVRAPPRSTRTRPSGPWRRSGPGTAQGAPARSGTRRLSASICTWSRTSRAPRNRAPCQGDQTSSGMYQPVKAVVKMKKPTRLAASPKTGYRWRETQDTTPDTTGCTGRDGRGRLARCPLRRRLLGPIAAGRAARAPPVRGGLATRSRRRRRGLAASPRPVPVDWAFDFRFWVVPSAGVAPAFWRDGPGF